jgi:hypothetical protein
MRIKDDRAKEGGEISIAHDREVVVKHMKDLFGACRFRLGINFFFSSLLFMHVKYVLGIIVVVNRIFHKTRTVH